MVYLTKGQVALVDPADEALVRQHTWCASNNGRGRFCAKTGKVRMHHAFLDKVEGLEVDHKNGNPLDNRRGNLRYATDAENGRNKRTKLRGVIRSSSKNKPFAATIVVSGKFIRLGFFQTKEEALKARVDAERQYFGEFAPYTR